MNNTRTGISTRSGISTVAASAAHEFRQADKLDTLDAPLKSVEAARARADGERLLEPPERLIGNASTELVPAPDLEAQVPAGRLCFLDTLAEPNTISVDASEHRAAVVTRAGVLSLALDEPALISLPPEVANGVRERVPSKCPGRSRPARRDHAEQPVGKGCAA